MRVVVWTSARQCGMAGDAPLETLGVEYDDSCFTLKESD